MPFKDFDAISVRYIKRFTPKLIFPAFRIAIFFEYFLIKFSSFFENPVVPITTLFFNFEAIFKTCRVHFGIVKSIITLAFLKALTEFCDKIGVKASLCTHWANGGEGTKELAAHVVDLCEKNEAKFKFLYESKTPLFKKIETIAKEIYRADEVIADTKIRDQLKSFEDAGYGDLPICIAKTQYSFSTDPSLKGAPTGHALPIREIRLSSGAEFIVVVCGAVMTMPGLPKVPAADSIKLNKDGEIEGLF